MRLKRQRSFFNPQRTFTSGVGFAAAISLLAACGGGDSASPPPPPPPPPPAPFQLDLPAQALVSFPEENLGLPDNIFTFDTPIANFTDQPTNIQLSGADAAFFLVEVTFETDPAGPLTAEVVLNVNIQPDQILDFEMPADANTDNQYEFELTFDYLGDPNAIPIIATIENVPEPVSLFLSEAAEGVDTQRLRSVGDIDGDGVEDILYDLSDGSSTRPENDAIRIISGALFDPNATEPLIVNLDTPALTTFDFGAEAGSVLSLDFQPDSDSIVFATAGAVSSGNPVVREYRLDSEAALQALLGNILTTDPSPNQIIYTPVMNPAGDTFLNRHFAIGDISGDDIPELINISNLTSGGQTFVGLRFGTAISDAASLNQDLIDDIQFTTNIGNENDSLFDTLPDIDGDNLSELVVTEIQAETSPSLTCILFSSFLNDPDTTNINFDALPVGAGQCVSSSPGEFANELPSFSIRSVDVVNIGVGEEIVILSGFNRDVIISRTDFDALPFPATVADVLNNGGRIIGTELPEIAGDSLSFGIANLTPVGDINGNGTTDFVAANRFAGSTFSVNPPYFLVTSEVISEVLDSTEAIVVPPEGALIPITFSGDPGTNLPLISSFSSTSIALAQNSTIISILPFAVLAQAFQNIDGSIGFEIQ